MHWTLRSAAFVCLSAFGVVALWGFADKNGTFELASQWASSNRLPETNEKYTTEFTHITRLDVFLRSILTFFWPMVNGTQPGSSLMCFYFAGQGTVAWILTMLEGMRCQNKTRWRVVSFTTTFGLLFQSMGIGIVGPLFFAFASLGDSWSDIGFVSNSELDSLPFSLITGLILPTVLMSLHAPTILTVQQKVDATRLWQFFPLLCYIAQWFWTALGHNIRPTTEQNPLAQRRALRRVYVFGLCCAAIPHIGTVCISLTALLFPHLFAADVANQFHPATIFFPVSPFFNVKATSLGQGAYWFLQWDMILMFCTYNLWAYFVHTKRYPSSKHALATVFRLLSATIFTGPMGAALLAIWERDETVFDREIGEAIERKN